MAIEWTLFLMLIISLLNGLFAHGVMQSPPARNFMWRLGFNTERNYDDVGLNCGGFSNQWDVNGGRCGACGDPFQGPRDHEAGGKYARFDRPISQCYNNNGKIDVKIRITAYHRGYFEFRLCAQNNLYTPVTQDCLNQRLLTITGSHNHTRYDIGYIKQEFYTFQLDIPEEVHCEQCVIQWLYNTGNSYGCDSTDCDVGLGKQEQFINCADIAILRDCSNFTLQKLPTVPNRQLNYGGKTSNWDQSHHTSTQWTNQQQMQWTTPGNNQWANHEHGHWTDDDESQWNTHQTNPWSDGDDDDADDNEESNAFSYDQTTVWRPAGLLTRSTPLRTNSHGCYAIGMFADMPDMNYWCDINCNAELPFCPKTHCSCGEYKNELYKPNKICFAVGFWGQLAGFNDWCHKNCNHNPSYCPKGVCRCF